MLWFAYCHWAENVFIGTEGENENENTVEASVWLVQYSCSLCKSCHSLTSSQTVIHSQWCCDHWDCGDIKVYLHTVCVLTVLVIIFGSGPSYKNCSLIAPIFFFFLPHDCGTHRTMLQLQWTGKWGFISLHCFNKWIYVSKEIFLLDRQGQWETLFCLLFSK